MPCCTGVYLNGGIGVAELKLVDFMGQSYFAFKLNLEQTLTIFIMFLMLSFEQQANQQSLKRKIPLNFDKTRKSLRCVEALNEYCNIFAKTTKTGHVAGDTRLHHPFGTPLHPCADDGNRISLTDLKRGPLYQIFPRKQHNSQLFTYFWVQRNDNEIGLSCTPTKMVLRNDAISLKSVITAAN